MWEDAADAVAVGNKRKGHVVPHVLGFASRPIHSVVGKP